MSDKDGNCLCVGVGEGGGDGNELLLFFPIQGPQELLMPLQGGL